VQNESVTIEFPSDGKPATEYSVAKILFQQSVVVIILNIFLSGNPGVSMAKLIIKRQPQSATTTEWSENLRGFISVLLLVHVAALVLLCFTNNQFAGERSTPNLVDKLKQAAVYLYPLGMDRPMDYYLTSGNPIDSDHWLEFEAVTDQQTKLVQFFPDPQLGSCEYRERWQYLARQVAVVGEGFDTQNFDAQILELGKSWLARLAANDQHAEQVVIRCRRRIRANLEEPIADFDPTGASSISPPIYSAIVKWSDRAQEPILAKLGGAARDKSPVVKPPATKQ
jgi:hypothetical protein